MKLLEERIQKDGTCIGTEIVKVDSFLNHQLDVALIRALGEEFARLFKDEKPNKILTLEASGIPIAFAAAEALGDLPVVFAKKAAPSTMVEDAYTAEVKSFTKGTVSTIRVAHQYLSKEDRVLIIDDFLASGEAGAGLLTLLEEAGAKCVGYGAAIEKEHQGGHARLEAMGVRVESLAVISSIKDGVIYFKA
ncbi:MAG: xanthine phosphoribosyltransferase [Firmicutes bacterium]|nr:xanthine phosphoribosyltransferase [Bacillota bacterium]